MLLICDINAIEDLKYWVRHDRKKADKILKLIEEVYRTPFSGTGKPEPLKHILSGCWSRRIDEEHRLVYRLENEQLTILSCRYHY
jgi:toxin YoeB